MNKKLTKEQAEWLLENIREKTWGICNDDVNMTGVDWKDVQSLTNQCTEKEFPELRHRLMYWGNTPFDISITLEKQANGKEEIHFNSGFAEKGRSDNDKTCFTIEEFKQFTEGCNKIVEYLNEKVD